MRGGRCWAVAVALALVGACGGSGDDTGRESTTSTPTGPASIEQYAAIVSEHSPELLEVIDAASGCLDGYVFPCEGGAAISVYRVGLQASLLSSKFGAGEAVPEEIEALVERTMAAAEAAQAHSEVFTAGNCGPQPGDDTSPADTCAEAARNALLANSEIQAALLAWEPHS
jgi:hypothetical protein